MLAGMFSFIIFQEHSARTYNYGFCLFSWNQFCKVHKSDLDFFFSFLPQAEQ
jgi:hypothetical protein